MPSKFQENIILNLKSHTQPNYQSGMWQNKDILRHAWSQKIYLPWTFLKNPSRDFPGGTVVKNLPANAGDTGSSPGPGRSHMPWGN